jgi:hypothetical protein
MIRGMTRKQLTQKRLYLTLASGFEVRLGIGPQLPIISMPIISIRIVPVQDIRD